MPKTHYLKRMEKPILLLVIFTVAACSEDTKPSIKPIGPLAVDVGPIICGFENICDERSALDFCLHHYIDESWITQTSNDSRLRAAQQAECLATAEDCDDYRACVYTSQTCTETRCDGSLAKNCQRSGLETTMDCAAQGLECVLVGVGAELIAKCGVPGETCDGQPELRCEGDIFLWCPGDAPTSPSVQNCSIQGKICNGVFCGEDGNCEDGVSCSADKSVMTYCIDGKPSSYLCKEIGPDFVCDETTGQCVTNAPSAACGPDGDTSHCDGDFAMICLHGFEVRVDCALAGGTCVHDVNTRCVPR